MKKVLLGLSVSLIAVVSQAQVLLSGGLTYSQNFDSLATSSTASGAWTDNTTLVGWYASKAIANSTQSYGPNAYTAYRVDNGGNNSGNLFSWGTTGSSDRALGSDASGTVGTNAIGLRIQNDTGAAVTYDVNISYTGEQWRNGGNVNAQNILSFSYLISSTPLTGLVSALATDPSYNYVPSLNFVSPTVGATATALDGNNALNRTAISGTLSSITLNPGQELMLRWVDINDVGNDHGGGIDDLTVNFTVPEPTTFALGGFAALGLVLMRRNRR